jgi:hypothetical protein
MAGGYGERVSEHAAELAVHFERGRDHWRAVQYLLCPATSHAGKARASVMPRAIC